jgi:hypothetical protein
VGGLGEQRRVTARCDRERGCPLYRKGDRLEFEELAVTGAEFAPVCARAVASLSPLAERVRAGEAPWHHDGSSCGGCPAGEAWFAFSAAASGRPGLMTPGFESFVVASLSSMKALAGVPPAVLRRLVPYLQERPVRPGETIVRAGERPETLTLIVDGRFLVVAREGGQERNVTTAGRGDCVGAEALLTGEPSDVTVTAWGAGQVLEAARRDVPSLLSAAPSMAVNLVREAMRRRVPAPEGPAWPRGGMAGTLEAILPAELIQAMHAHGHTGGLTRAGVGRGARGHCAGGDVVDARGGGATGAEALFAILRW